MNNLLKQTVLVVDDQESIRLALSKMLSKEGYEVFLAEEGESALSPGSQQVLDVWEQMDTGLIKDAGEAFDEADRRVRERHQAAEGA